MFLAKEEIRCSVETLRHLRLITERKNLNNVLANLAEKQEKTTIVSWLNAHVFTLTKKDPILAAHLLKSSLLLRDGIGISVLLRLLGKDAGLNLNGTDLIPEILRHFAGRPIALLGTCEPYLSQAAEAVETLGGQVVLRMDGFQEPEAYARQLAEKQVDLVVLGMGVPKQEQVAFFLADKLARPTLILNGGAILDFMAGRFPRAPKLWRQLRLEWMFRLLQEPRRLGWRYSVGVFLFISYTAQIIYAVKRNPRWK